MNPSNAIPTFDLDRTLVGGPELLPRFRSIVDGIDDVPRGVLVSEIFFIVATLGAFRPRQIIESGRAMGQSTLLLGRCFPDTSVLSIEYDADHPELFASADNGATPIEFVLVGLASCLTAGVASIAQHREIQLRSVKATLTGKMDVQGVMGVDPDVRNGFSDIGVHFEIDADATQADLDALVAQSQKRSAVFDIVSNPTLIAVDVN